MLLKTVLVRFYKSFNFDYLRKYHKEAIPKRWEKLRDMWFPYIRVPIDSQVTTVVGANESGKSHLLGAIKKGISGEGIERRDFCRYSQFFAVEEGKLRWPDFGFEWTNLTHEEQQAIRTACGIQESTPVGEFYLFRNGKDKLTVYVRTADDYSEHEVAANLSKGLLAVLPSVFEIDAHLALPESVPISWLTGRTDLRFDRKRRFDLQELFTARTAWFQTQKTVANAASEIASEFSKILPPNEPNETPEGAEWALARDLLFKVARIDVQALEELFKAIRDGNDGHANGITQKINDALESSLNFPRWWVQDRAFRLMVTPREHDLVFTIHDRTGTEYSFAERSSGLRYFLSYYIQYLAHEPVDGRPEILLMDEPDAYLSSQGQQDLLKIFEAFSNPEDDRPRVQVVYVTHSPFLINKNHGERIRVLEKGVGDEGTRVVRDASKNHYEPLRSAFGSFVGETTFIGHCNLLVEGLSDQILIAGAAAQLRSSGASELETLDLNRITIVPAGSASHIPYLVYLARGRDIERPAVIVLLDSDAAGNQARKDLERGGPRGKQLLAPEYVLQLEDLCENVAAKTGASTATQFMAIEDLVPVGIAAKATQRYLREMCDAPDDVLKKLSKESIRRHHTESRALFDAVEAAVSEASSKTMHVDKVGFARNVVAVAAEQECDDVEREEWERNMKCLFARIRPMQRKAERELTRERVSHRVGRAKNAFLRDHPLIARREQVVVLIEEIESTLDDSREADEVRRGLQGIRRQFKLNEDAALPVKPYSEFKEALERVEYAPRIAVQEAVAAGPPTVARVPKSSANAPNPATSVS